MIDLEGVVSRFIGKPLTDHNIACLEMAVSRELGGASVFRSLDPEEIASIKLMYDEAGKNTAVLSVGGERDYRGWVFTVNDETTLEEMESAAEDSD